MFTVIKSDNRARYALRPSSQLENSSLDYELTGWDTCDHEWRPIKKRRLANTINKSIAPDFGALSRMYSLKNRNLRKARPTPKRSISSTRCENSWRLLKNTLYMNQDLPKKYQDDQQSSLHKLFFPGSSATTVRVPFSEFLKNMESKARTPSRLPGRSFQGKHKLPNTHS